MLARIRRRIYKYSFFLKPLTGSIVLFVIIILTIKAIFPFVQFARRNNITPHLISSLLFDTPSSLRTSEGRSNILILGIGGATHEGPDLTDSIIFLSLDLKKHDAVMLSIPRDIYISSLKDKINSAYAYGEAKKKGGGLILAKSSVEEIVGQPIHYAWLIDFSGFNNLINLVGGIDVNVKNSFDDTTYPIEGKENDECDGDKKLKCRYEHLHFEKGWQHMDGETALKYVRSRNANGDEGSDFARGQRQQQVILALKDKILHHTDWENLDFDKKLLKAFDEATDTDMNWSETLLLGKLFLTIKPDQIKRPVLNSDDETKGKKGFLTNPPTWEYHDTWVLIPRKGENDFSEIGNYIRCFLENPQCSLTP